ncbi:MAG TPA: LacI family DNA-binding transcriptional regulator [Ktedonobacteraceae bacterium]|nr:LacI family DNA-binding transcriptional regulator [Ktedonobacteraceae bacterium]
MGASVTVKDVAREAEVSVGTVSRVFNNHQNVAEEIRQRVLKAAAELGYTRPIHQDAARNGSRAIKEIGFLYCSIDALDTNAVASNPFWSHILHGVESEARKTNIKVTYRTISALTSTPHLLLSTIQDMRLGGILLVGPAELETIQQIRTLKTPLVLVDNYAPRLSIDAVLGDNFEGARAAVDYLIEQGHRRIAFIGGPTLPGPRPLNRIYTLERRAAGYRTALLDAGLPVNYELFESCNLDPESGYAACKRLLQRNASFTALFCANDETAIGAMKALREAGLRIPDDVSLIGFDDIALVEHLTPALTTVRVPKEALGAMAVKQLLTRAADPDMVGVSSVLEVELIKRASVASCRA